jgi:serine/threonine-protein kinase
MATPPSEEQPPSLAYAAGDLIAGKYELEQILGEGGMGAVFRARNTAIDMPVAIKVIRTDLNRELLSGRLLQEARAAAKLAHPAIVRVFDVGQTSLGDPFIVMELLNGESLSATMEREGRLTSVRAVQLLLPIADALSAAHAKGFVHRDVKPDNVFIVVSEEQLQPKLVDFGIVKLEQHDKDSQLTQAGVVLGSPDYMSPEQARGLETIDLRSDVWSFAVMLYEAISGETPFSSANYNALLRMIVEQEPTSLLELKAADEELSAIVARGMSKDPELRFQSMNQFGRALAEWLVARGFVEDACGVSLETKWLNRSTDPQARPAGRVSSSPQTWSEPPPGVRAVHPDFGSAPTVGVGKEAGTPTSVLPLAATIPPRARRVYLGLAGGAVALALSLLWVALSSGTQAAQPKPQDAPIETSPEQLRPAAMPVLPPPAATTVSPPVTPTGYGTVAVPMASSSAAKNKSRPVSPPAQTRSGAAKPAAPREPAKASPAPAPGKPGSDLLSPY